MRMRPPPASELVSCSRFSRSCSRPPGPAADLTGRTDAPGVLAPGHAAIVRLAQTAPGQAQNPMLAALFAKAAAGDPAAQNHLGEKFATGEDVGRDLAEAARWYRLAAEQGYAEAQLNLGELYENGQGVEQDLGEAARWYREAAAGGEVLAQLTLGLWSREGRGVPVDHGEAVRWFRAVAERGFAIGQINLAFMYLDGLGVARDDAMAAALLMKAAGRGHPVAQNNLGLLCRRARRAGGSQACRRMARARPARAGQCPVSAGPAVRAGRRRPGTMLPPRAGIRRRRDREVAAQTRLGLMYRDGRGVPQDQALAYAWLSLAAEATSERAETDEPARARAELAGRLSAAELAAGRAQIDALRRRGAAAP